jgi:hypothetical protein
MDFSASSNIHLRFHENYTESLHGEFNMFVNSVIGLHNAMALLGRGAKRINRDEVIEGFVDMQNAVRQAQANITAIRTEDKMSKTLIDLYA